MTTNKTYVVDVELPARIAALAERLEISQGKVIEAAVTLLEKDVGVKTEPEGGAAG